jgi:UDP-3-O-[3-hydroxymyristoyl] glucosamine N-acyltransferase
MNLIAMIDPSAVVDPTAEIGFVPEDLRDAFEGCTIMTIIGAAAKIQAYARIDVGVRIGAFATIGPSTYINFGSDVGTYVAIGTGSVLDRCVTVGHHTVFGEDVWVGRDTIIGPYCSISVGVSIGDVARLGSGVGISTGVIIKRGQHVPDHWRIRQTVSNTSHLGLQLMTGVHPDPEGYVRLMKPIDANGFDPDIPDHRYVEGHPGPRRAFGYVFYPPRMVGEWCRRDGATHVVSVRVHADDIQRVRNGVLAFAYDDARLFYVRT